MSTGLIITLAVVAAVLIAVALIVFTLRSGSHGRAGLRRRFGPEYERAVAQHDGDNKAAEKELQERVRRHEDLRVQPLTPMEREPYLNRWAEVQERFVDAPEQAVIDADGLLARLAAARGYPDEGYDEQVAALSVHHPQRTGGYRRVHAVAGQARSGPAPTEELREALVQGRALFEELIAEPADSQQSADRADRTGETGRRSGNGDRRPAHGHRRGGGHHLAERLHLTRSGRGDDTTGGHA